MPIHAALIGHSRSLAHGLATFAERLPIGDQCARSLAWKQAFAMIYPRRQFLKLAMALPTLLGACSRAPAASDLATPAPIQLPTARPTPTPAAQPTQAA